MTLNRLPLVVVLADSDIRGPRGRSPNTCEGFIPNVIEALSEEQGLRGTLMKAYTLYLGARVWFGYTSLFL